MCIPPAYLLKHLQVDACATRSAFLLPIASFYFFIRVFATRFPYPIFHIFVKIRTLLTQLKLSLTISDGFSVELLPILIRLNADRGSIRRQVGKRCKHSAVTTWQTPVRRVALNGKFPRSRDHTLGRWVVFGCSMVGAEYYEMRWVCDLTNIALRRRILEISPFDYGYAMWRELNQIVTFE